MLHGLTRRKNLDIAPGRTPWLVMEGTDRPLTGSGSTESGAAEHADGIQQVHDGLHRKRLDPQD
jgi:hypothetical protein